MPQTKPGCFTWFECGTKDVAQAKSFYHDVFGWTSKDMPMPGDGPGMYTLFQIDGEDVAGLYELSGPMFEGVPPHWMSYVAVEDCDEAASRAKSLGGTLLSEPMDVPGVGRMAFVKDPTGASIAVFQAGEHAGMSEKTNLGWCELHTPDTAVARAFYCELFNWSAKDDALGHYTEWQVEGQSIGGMMAIPPEQRAFMPPHWLPYAMVDDCDATLKKATDRGARVLVPGTDIEGVGRFSVFQDPSGAAIAMIKLSEHGA